MRWFVVASLVLVPLSLVVGLSAATAGERSRSGGYLDARGPVGWGGTFLPSASPPFVRRMVLGHSVLGRPVIAFQLGDPTSQTTILVVGCIHGDESAGTAIARSLIAAPPADVDLWVIRNLNPDGFRAGTRQNGRGVDLNRNFPFQWRPVGRPWDNEYSGPHPLSEPEGRIARRLIARVHPDVSIWFHQPLGLVVRSAGDITIQRRFARRVGLPLVRLTERYPGSVTRWQNHWHPEASAFVVELPSGSLSSRAVDRYVNAIVNAAT
jgi:protein MpaA